MLEFGWFSSGRDQAAIELLRVVLEAIDNGKIDGRVSFVFVSRDKGEKPESDQFISFAEGRGLRVLTFSHRNFKPDMRRKALEDSKKLGVDSPSILEWRREYDQEVMKMIECYPCELIVLAGYMLIVSPEMCQRYNMINLHPALPGGPKGTWQEVIWQLMEQRATKTGVMMHLITAELDAGPPITFCEFSISDEKMKPLWDDWFRKRQMLTLDEIKQLEGEDEPLFKEIRRRGLLREFPIIVHTLKAISDGKFIISNGEVISEGKRLEKGYDLTAEVEKEIT